MVNQINDHHLSDKKPKEVCQGFPDEWSQFAHECPLLRRVISLTSAVPKVCLPEHWDHVINSNC